MKDRMTDMDKNKVMDRVLEFGVGAFQYVAHFTLSNKTGAILDDLVVDMSYTNAKDGIKNQYMGSMKVLSINEGLEKLSIVNVHEVNEDAFQINFEFSAVVLQMTLKRTKSSEVEKRVARTMQLKIPQQADFESIPSTPKSVRSNAEMESIKINFQSMQEIWAKKVKESEEAKETLQKEIDECRRQREEMKQCVEECKKEALLAVTRPEYDDLRARLEELEKSRATREDVCRLEEELNKSMQENEALKSRVEELEAALRQSEEGEKERNESLMQRIEALEERLAEHEQGHKEETANTTPIDTLEQRVETLEGQLKQYEEEHKKEEEEMEKEMEEIKESIKKNDEEEQGNEEVQKTIETLQTEVEQLKEKTAQNTAVVGAAAVTVSEEKESSGSVPRIVTYTDEVIEVCQKITSGTDTRHALIVATRMEDGIEIDVMVTEESAEAYKTKIEHVPMYSLGKKLETATLVLDKQGVTIEWEETHLTLKRVSSVKLYPRIVRLYHFFAERFSGYIDSMDLEEEVKQDILIKEMQDRSDETHNSSVEQSQPEVTDMKVANAEIKKEPSTDSESESKTGEPPQVVPAKKRPSEIFVYSSVPTKFQARRIQQLGRKVPGCTFTDFWNGYGRSATPIAIVLYFVHEKNDDDYHNDLDALKIVYPNVPMFVVILNYPEYGLQPIRMDGKHVYTINVVSNLLTENDVFEKFISALKEVKSLQN